MAIAKINTLTKGILLNKKVSIKYKKGLLSFKKGLFTKKEDQHTQKKRFFTYKKDLQQIVAENSHGKQPPQIHTGNPQGKLSRDAEDDVT